MTFSDTLKTQAAQMGIPLRTLSDVTSFLSKAKGPAAARLLLNHGRLTEEAKVYVSEWLAAFSGAKTN